MLRGFALLGLVAVGCAGLPASPPGAASTVTRVPRPTWLGAVAEHLPSIEACLQLRLPVRSAAVDVALLQGARVGVVSLGDDGRIERCVVDGAGRVVHREADRQGLRPASFAGQPAVTPGPDRPAIGDRVYAETLIRAGRPVGWVHWRGVRARRGGR